MAALSRRFLWSARRAIFSSINNAKATMATAGKKAAVIEPNGDVVKNASANASDEMSSVSRSVKIHSKRNRACAANLSSLMVFYLKHGLTKCRLAAHFRRDPSLLHMTYDQEKFEELIGILRELCLDDEAAVERILRINPGVLGQESGTLRQTVECLRSLRLEEKLLLSNPMFLSVEDMAAKISFLCSCGLSREAFGRVFKKWHKVLSLSLDEILKPKVGFLAECAIVGKDLERLLLKYPWFLRSSNVTLEECLPLFKEAGLEGKHFAKMVAWYPGTLKSADSLAAREDFLLSTGLDKDSEVFKSALSVVASMKLDILQPRMLRLIKYGFSTAEACEMFRKQPRILLVSDAFLVKKMRFLKDCVKLPHEKFLASPNYLIYSLEKRLQPRFHVAALVISNGLMKEEPKWKSIFYSTEAVFKKSVEIWHPEARAIYNSVKPVAEGKKSSKRAEHKHEKMGLCV